MDSMDKKFLICIVGPTAIGKTSLSISLGKAFSTNIVSADSRQFYKEMSIGTAVPSIEELTSVPHHFIQHLSVTEPYSVGDYEKDSLNKLRELFQGHNSVILVGGSGLYVEAVTRGLDRFPKVDPTIREQLVTQLEEDSLEPLQNKLKELDPLYYEQVDLQNPHRVIRALEICIGTGLPFSSFRNQEVAPRNFETVYIGLNAERKLLYDRINLRVDNMMTQGLLEEVEALYPLKHLNALNTVGYKELFKYIDREYSLEEAVGEIKKNTRRYAKRQLTWYRKRSDIHWFDYLTPHDSIIEYVEKILEQKT